MSRIEPGTVVLDRYIVLKHVVGTRATDIYKAKATANDEEVVIKMLRRGVSDVVSQRFEREARLMSVIMHPNVVRLFTYGNVEGNPCLVMESIDGERLDRIITRDGAVPWQSAVKWTIALLSGLEAVHRANVVHRDVAPANIVVTPDGKTKLANLDLATMLGGATAVTATKELLGIPHYIAPERALDRKSATPKSDIYSLGATLYHMLTGKVPFEARNFQQLREAFSRPAPLPVAPEGFPTVPPGIQAAVLNALAADPKERTKSARLFATDLRNAMRKAGTSQSQPGSAKEHRNAGERPPSSTGPHRPAPRTGSHRPVTGGEDLMGFGAYGEGPPADATHIPGAQAVRRSKVPGGTPQVDYSSATPEKGRPQHTTGSWRRSDPEIDSAPAQPLVTTGVAASGQPAPRQPAPAPPAATTGGYGLDDPYAAENSLELGGDSYSESLELAEEPLPPPAAPAPSVDPFPASRPAPFPAPSGSQNPFAAAADPFTAAAPAARVTPPPPADPDPFPAAARGSSAFPAVGQPPSATADPFPTSDPFSAPRPPTSSYALPATNAGPPSAMEREPTGGWPTAPPAATTPPPASGPPLSWEGTGWNPEAAPTPRPREGGRTRSNSSPALGLRTGRTTGQHVPIEAKPRLPPGFPTGRNEAVPAPPNASPYATTRTRPFPSPSGSYPTAAASDPRARSLTPVPRTSATRTHTPMSAMPAAPVDDGGGYEFGSFGGDDDLPIDYSGPDPDAPPEPPRNTRFSTGSSTLRHGTPMPSRMELPADVELPPLRRTFAMVACRTLPPAPPATKVGMWLEGQLKSQGGVRIVNDELFLVVLQTETELAGGRLTSVVTGALSKAFGTDVRHAHAIDDDAAFERVLEDDSELPPLAQKLLASLADG